jgi:hypothetical protein
MERAEALYEANKPVFLKLALYTAAIFVIPLGSFALARYYLLWDVIQAYVVGDGGGERRVGGAGEGGCLLERSGILAIVLVNVVIAAYVVDAFNEAPKADGAEGRRGDGKKGKVGKEKAEKTDDKVDDDAARRAGDKPKTS